jgi:drug/metabolite transporter (DMT)-like permease
MFVAHAAVPGVTEPAQIAIVLVFVGAVYAALAWLVLRERTGRTTLVGRLADRVGGS